MRRLAVLSLSIAAAGCHCGNSETIGGACHSSADCANGLVCVAGVCQAGDGGLAGDGGADAGCVLKCGLGCCGAGAVCVSDQCQKDCGALTHCGTYPNDACCTSSQLCYLGGCVVPGSACTASSQCPKGDYCDPTVGKCLPIGPNGACEYHPDGGFSPAPLWTYQVTTDAFDQVMMAPVVVDVNGDGIPDVLSNFFQGGGYTSPGVMRALSGDTGKLLWTTANDAADNIYPAASIAAGDLDGSGKIVAVTIGASGLLIAFDGTTGTRLWTSHDGTGAGVTCSANWGGPSLADLDGDGKAEVICGLEAFDSTGLLLWNHGLGAGAIGPLSVAADLDGDGKLEVTDGANAYHWDGSALWTAAGFGGFPAIGDFVNAAGALGRDGKPEIVSVNAGQVAIVNGQTGQILIGPATLPSWNGTACVQGGGVAGNGGPPTIADFDGDGRPEIGVADQDCYTVLKPTGSAGSLSLQVLWSMKVQDHSSSVTGSSVFDFNGDGIAEVVYADEVRLHVFEGPTGAEIFSRLHCSGTTYELPVIVDINGNGRADIVVCENTYAAAGLGCDASVTSGIHVFHDAADNWVNTRSVWNQHAYHVTNVCDGNDFVCGGPGAAGNTYGRIPPHEPPNWAFANAPDGGAPLNNFRQNVQGEGLFNAPDLVGQDLQSDASGCPSKMVLSLRVLNQGAIGVLPGLHVAFYAVEPTGNVLLGVAQTQGRLLPGQSEVVKFTWSPINLALPVGVIAVVNDDGTGHHDVNECVFSNDTTGPLTVACIG